MDAFTGPFTYVLYACLKFFSVAVTFWLHLVVIKGQFHGEFWLSEFNECYRIIYGTITVFSKGLDS